MEVPNNYNIRVYGLLINENREVLVTDEYRINTAMTKFPGGGLHFGEGLADCVMREWMEELNVEVVVDKLFYINDFLQISAFNSRDQILAVYYLVSTNLPLPVQVSHLPFDFGPRVEGAQSFRWLSLDRIGPNDFTFPIDKQVSSLLAEWHRSNPNL